MGFIGSRHPFDALPSGRIFPFTVMLLELISIELTNRCAKACWFCYNHSLPEGETRWQADEVVPSSATARERRQGVSFGGGEPLQYSGLFDVLHQLDGILFRPSRRTACIARDARPPGRRESEQGPISIHFPERAAEVNRVITRSTIWPAGHQERGELPGHA